MMALSPPFIIIEYLKNEERSGCPSLKENGNSFFCICLLFNNAPSVGSSKDNVL